MKGRAIWSLVFAAVVQYATVSAFEFRKISTMCGSDLPVKVDITDASTGQNYNLKLTKPDGSVLHPTLKYISIDKDQETGRRIHETFLPSQHDLHVANHVHVDHENQAVVRVTHDKNENRVLNGIVNGMRFHEKDGIAEFLDVDTEEASHHHYIETNVNLTYTNVYANKNAEDSQDYIVEMAIVCDKEWGDYFQHDRQKILEYWTVYFWDLNLRYKTLPKSNISFRITSIIVMKTLEEQPWVEDSRDEQGRAMLNQVLGKFAYWIWEQANELPKFDMAMAVLKTPISYSAGIAYLRGACRPRAGSVVWGDGGSFRSVGVGAHEIAHNLGAPEDHDVPDCTAKGYIMSGGGGYKQFHFSECSDRTIAAYVSSDQAACLQRIDESSDPVIHPDFNSASPPSMDEQCTRWMGQESAYWRGKSDCTKLWCWKGNTAYCCLTPAENTPCGDDGNGPPTGRCFRGICYSNSSHSFLVNAGSGQCLLGTDRFSGSDTAEMSNCPTVATPLNQFSTLLVQRGRHLKTLYSTHEEIPDVSKCLVGNAAEGGQVGFGKCSTAAGNLSEWGLEEVGTGEYLLKEATTKRCAKQEGDLVKVFANCNQNDRAMRWKISLNDN